MQASELLTGLSLQDIKQSLDTSLPHLVSGIAMPVITLAVMYPFIRRNVNRSNDFIERKEKAQELQEYLLNDYAIQLVAEDAINMQENI